MSTRFTGDDFLAWFRRGMGGITTDEWSDAACMQLINKAQEQIALVWGSDIGHLEASEDITTVADQEVYTLSATDVLDVRYLSSSSYPRLKKKDHDYRLRVQDLPTTTPWGWYIAGGSSTTKAWKIGLIGTPSSAGDTITVWYTVAPPEIKLAGDGLSAENESVLPQSFDIAIVQEAVKLAKSLSQQILGAQRQASFANEASGRAGGGSLPGTIDHVYQVAGFEHGERRGRD